jgi:uncharacterized protein YbjT (DUF2867 family)
VSAIVVFGATGGLGQQVVEAALEHGHAVTAVARNPSAVRLQHDRLTVLRGDVLAPETLGEAMARQSAVILAIGGSNASRDRRTPSSTCTAGTRNVLSAMGEHGVSRVVAVSSWGVGESLPRIPLFYRWVIFPRILREDLIDKGRQEELLRASDRQWTIVRPSRLTNGPTARHMAVGERLRYGVRASISRADVAEFMLAAVDAELFVHQTVEISDHAIG